MTTVQEMENALLNEFERETQSGLGIQEFKEVEYTCIVMFTIAK